MSALCQWLDRPFDHVAGERDQQRRKGEAKRLGFCRVKEEIELGRFQPEER
jgi:hypothetical protein